ncbi:cation-dependent mannose-6-phosphate receptor [Geosmithia morbida]|uniref:Cation-dependent mannose-6-phosphate receptor n=1 Tax=Geosmithia morbida TaxID=1094350 RepID=A0A9P4YPM2_9HYPO|nr:cation-dependent mannose-6-phosphate receptor [Geosmithia morbida]KAF4119306.1 cation-dependent mannose-6-phosphate receptor [Geosmithia morbida]
MRNFSSKTAAVALAAAASALLFATPASADTYYDDDRPTSTVALPACTATSSTGSGAYFDLRPDIAYPDDGDRAHKSASHKDYLSRGYDYGKNFTMNVCGPVVEPITGVVGVDEDQWADVSGYYISDGAIYSIGSRSMDLRSRGRKLFVQYTGGSPCGPDAGKTTTARRRDASPDVIADKTSTAHDAVGSDGDDDLVSTPHPHRAGDSTVRRKSTIISFLCDRDPTVSGTTISFVGTDPDECAYFFDARSIHACPAAEPHRPGSVGPGSIFGIIVLVAILVYLLGGIFYNRTINNARGWRQLPNFSLWAGIWSFVSDLFIIAIFSCARCLPGRRGYSSLRNSSAVHNSRESDQEDQRNALIDQLDEEWED